MRNTTVYLSPNNPSNFVDRHVFETTRDPIQRKIVIKGTENTYFQGSNRTGFANIILSNNSLCSETVTQYILKLFW